MGGEQSKKRDEIVSLVEDYPCSSPQVISEQEMIYQIFRSLDLAPKHSSSGTIVVSGSHLLRRFFQLFATVRNNTSTASRAKVIDTIRSLFDDPKQAIEYSYRTIQPHPTALITRKLFTEFVGQCFTSGVEAVLRYSKENQNFKVHFAEWAARNKVKIVEEADRIFSEHALSERDEWTRGDYKRWVLSNTHWSLLIDIKNTAYRIPLNLPCLFGVVLLPQKK